MESRSVNALWFTFKFVSLNHWKQPRAEIVSKTRRCDLLSNLYLWTIGNNRNQGGYRRYIVVIYFQICIFEPLETTNSPGFFGIQLLWFTFKFVSLNHWKQLCSWGFLYSIRCDLLSNLYLWTIGNNTTSKSRIWEPVVIYFQICIFEPLETTSTTSLILTTTLWFTFKFVSLNHWKQQCHWRPADCCGCDLLSNLYLWTIGNNCAAH